MHTILCLCGAHALRRGTTHSVLTKRFRWVKKSNNIASVGVEILSFKRIEIYFQLVCALVEIERRRTNLSVNCKIFLVFI